MTKENFIKISKDYIALTKPKVILLLVVTAISAANYPNVVNNYRIMSCGASIGRNYGPIVVSKKPLKMNDLDGTKIAVPGIYTTSWMLFQIFCL